MGAYIKHTDNAGIKLLVEGSKSFIVMYNVSGLYIFVILIEMAMYYLLNHYPLVSSHIIPGKQIDM